MKKLRCFKALALGEAGTRERSQSNKGYRHLSIDLKKYKSRKHVIKYGSD